MTRATAYRPPPPFAPIAWPADFGQRFTIFVDTEEEFDWRAPFDRAERSVTNIAATPDAAERFAGLGAPLTFLIDHPVATDPGAIDHLRRALETRGCAVGTQLHPWVNPPFNEVPGLVNSFAGNLPRDLEAAKLDVLTTAITDAFGTPPIVYRAGRYGIGPETLGLLARRGYRFDTSMRARFDYRGQGGPDFSRVGSAPFRTAEGLVELPLTTVFTGAARRSGGAGLYRAAARLPHGPGVLARTGLLARVALSPEGMPLADALEAVAVAAGEGLALLNFAFHSPSLVPGHTPYVRDAADLLALWCWWEAILAALDRLGVRAIGLDDLAAATLA